MWKNSKIYWGVIPIADDRYGMTGDVQLDDIMDEVRQRLDDQGIDRTTPFYDRRLVRATIEVYQERAGAEPVEEQDTEETTTDTDEHPDEDAEKTLAEQRADTVTDAMDGEDWMTAKEIADAADLKNSLYFHNTRRDVDWLQERLASKPDPDGQGNLYRLTDGPAQEPADDQQEQDDEHECRYCGDLFENAPGRGQHERFCDDNPDAEQQDRRRVDSDDIDELVERYRTGDATLQELADEYGVSRKTASNYVQDQLGDDRTCPHCGGSFEPNGFGFHVRQCEGGDDADDADDAADAGEDDVTYTCSECGQEFDAPVTANPKYHDCDGAADDTGESGDGGSPFPEQGTASTPTSPLDDNDAPAPAQTTAEVKQVVDEDASADGDGEYDCEYCGRSFSTERGRNNHEGGCSENPALDDSKQQPIRHEPVPVKTAKYSTVPGQYLCTDCGAAGDSKFMKNHELDVHDDDYERDYKKVDNIPDDEGVDRWIIIYENNIGTEWQHPKQREARKSRIEAVLEQHDHALDLKQIWGKMGDFYNDTERQGCRGPVDRGQLLRLLEEMVDEDRLQQDGDTWTVPDRTTHQERVAVQRS